MTDINYNNRTELSEGEIELIAEKAAEKAIKKVYSEIGQNVVQKIVWFIGIISVCAFMYMSGKGFFLK